MSDMKTKGLFHTACELLEEQLKPVVECGGHGWQPFAIVCTHLAEQESTEWHRVELANDDCREVDCDWLCLKCLGKYEAGDESIVDDLRPVCMDCMKKVRQYEVLSVGRTEWKRILQSDERHGTWPCLFCKRKTNLILQVTDATFSKECRIALDMPGAVRMEIGKPPPDEPAAFSVCDKCMHLDQQTIIRVLHQTRKNMKSRRQNRRRTVRDGQHRIRTGRVTPICPRCGRTIPDADESGVYPGCISRVDHQTEICSSCAQEESCSWPLDPCRQEAWVMEQRAEWKRK